MVDKAVERYVVGKSAEELTKWLLAFVDDYGPTATGLIGEHAVAGVLQRQSWSLLSRAVGQTEGKGVPQPLTPRATFAYDVSTIVYQQHASGWGGAWERAHGAPSPLTFRRPSELALAAARAASIRVPEATLRELLSEAKCTRPMVTRHKKNSKHVHVTTCFTFNAIASGNCKPPAFAITTNT